MLYFLVYHICGHKARFSYRIAGLCGMLLCFAVPCAAMVFGTSLHFCRKKLRKAYLAAIRKNLRGSLNRIDIQNKDGSIENLGEKYGNKKGH